MLARYGHIEAIPTHADLWDIKVRGAQKLAATLAEQRDLAFLFRDLATLRTDAEVFASVEELRWAGPTPDFAATAEQLRAPALLTRAKAVAARAGASA